MEMRKILYHEVVLYIIFGILTTLVNTIIYLLAAHFFDLQTVPSAILAWFAAVLFAYLTNRKWVFHSGANSRNKVLKEIFAFYICRLVTGIVDWMCMYIFVDIFKWNDVIIKLGANLLVIILNYIASRIIVFQKK